MSSPHSSDPKNLEIAQMSQASILRGMRKLSIVALFVIPFGIAFGVAATEQGLTPGQALIMSAVVFTAIVQFAILDFLSPPIALFSLSLVALALSGRHVVMGAALSKSINELPLGKRLLTLAFLSDAPFAEAQTTAKNGRSDPGIVLGGGLVLWLAWLLGTAIGAYGGALLGDTDAYGFGAVLLSFFAATLLQMTRRSQGMLLPVLVAMAVSAFTLPFLPMGWNILLAAPIGGAIALMTHRE